MLHLLFMASAHKFTWLLKNGCRSHQPPDVLPTPPKCLPVLIKAPAKSRPRVPRKFRWFNPKPPPKPTVPKARSSTSSSASLPPWRSRTPPWRRYKPAIVNLEVGGGDEIGGESCGDADIDDLNVELQGKRCGGADIDDLNVQLDVPVHPIVKNWNGKYNLLRSGGLADGEMHRRRRLRRRDVLASRRDKRKLSAFAHYGGDDIDDLNVQLDVLVHPIAAETDDDEIREGIFSAACGLLN